MTYISHRENPFNGFWDAQNWVEEAYAVKKSINPYRIVSPIS